MEGAKEYMMVKVGAVENGISERKDGTLTVEL